MLRSLPSRLGLFGLALLLAAITLLTSRQDASVPILASSAWENDPGLTLNQACVATPDPSPLAATAASDSGLDGPSNQTDGRPPDPSAWFPTYPLPDSDPPPLTPGSFGAGFAAPLPSSPVWNPPGQKRVGLQAGHWMTSDVPNELRRLSPGTSGGGIQEWEINLLLATRTAALLEDAGVLVDLLPTTIPPRYRAHLFLSIHADGDTSGQLHGYKIARPGFSSIPAADDDLVRTLYREYGAATGMARDDDAHISRRMTFYYAFNTRRYAHAIDLGTPSALIEAGFLTNATDRAFLSGQTDVAARGIANGVLRFLELEDGAAEWGRAVAPMP
jgi:hypothetical protein